MFAKSKTLNQHKVLKLNIQNQFQRILDYGNDSWLIIIFWSQKCWIHPKPEERFSQDEKSTGNQSNDIYQYLRISTISIGAPSVLEISSDSDIIVCIDFVYTICRKYFY